MTLAALIPLGIQFDLDRIDAVGLGTLALAGATVVLAAATVIMARSAREDRRIAQDSLDAVDRQAAIAQQHAETAQKTLDSEIRPLLIEVPVDLSREDPVYYPFNEGPVSNVGGGVLASADQDGVRVTIPFRNAGRGIASVQAAYLEAAGAAAGYAAKDLTRPNVPVGEEVRANFVFRNGEAGSAEIGHRIRTTDDLIVAIRYADITGRQVTTTKVTVRFRSTAHTNWEVVYMEVGEPDSGEIPPPGALGPPPV